MSGDNSLNLSIQLEENEEKRQQELDEFVQLTKKIAQSDRNNDLLRQIKKNKLAEVGKIRMAHCELQQEKDVLRERFDEISESLKQEKFLKVKRHQELEELNGRFDHLSKKQRALEEQSSSIGKDNDRLEKQILKMQMQYEDLLRRNKEKDETLAKLRRQKDEQNSKHQENENKINQLQAKCEKSKANAQRLEIQMKNQYETNQKLQKILKDKEQQLKKTRRQRQDNAKRNQQTRRTNSKLYQKIKSIEDVIDKKEDELKRVSGIHEKLERQIDRFIQSQRTYQQILARRSNILMELKKDCQEVKKVKKYEQL